MQPGFLAGKKTYALGILAILSAWVAVAVGDLSTADAIKATFAALMTMTIRHGVTTETAKMILLFFIASFALAGCATTDQKQPTKQEQPQDQTSAQSDEQWADIRINATNNFYGSTGASKKPAVVDGDTVTEATPGDGGSAPSAASFSSSPVSVSITVTTHGQSSKEGTTGQTGGSQSSNTSATATPTNTPTTEVPISVTPVP